MWKGRRGGRKRVVVLIRGSQLLEELVWNVALVEWTYMYWLERTVKKEPSHSVAARDLQ